MSFAFARAQRDRDRSVDDHPGWAALGLDWARDIERVRGAVRLHVASSGFGNETGFAYSPAGEPPTSGEDTYWHLEGPWYVWHESW